jgi:hypothetical protein
MISLDFKSRRFYGIVGLITIFSFFALWLRLLPMLNMGNTDVLMLVASDDPLYNLRQVEQILANFPNYGWFDPMTQYPHGSPIYWGPLFPTVIAVFCLIAGAATRPELCRSYACFRILILGPDGKKAGRVPDGTRSLVTAESALLGLWDTEIRDAFLPGDDEWEECVEGIITRAGYRVIR